LLSHFGDEDQAARANSSTPATAFTVDAIRTAL
jgi:hypothetical protein